jgi:glycosyltransferase involved in cell wall biosynthesis
MEISVVIPVLNQSELLRECLLGIAQCSGARPEVIVVDDGSSADYRERIAAVVRECGHQVAVLDRHRGPSAARNYGVKVSSGDVVLFLDADVVPHGDCFERVKRAFETQPDLAALMGSYDSEPSAPGVVSQYRNLLHSYIHHCSEGKAESFWTGCGAVRRDAFVAAGGFHEVYDRPSIEDVEFGVRVAASGRRIVLDPEIQVKHQKGWTLGSMIETDLLYRALPWTVLAWSGAGLPANLNFTQPRRASVAGTFAATVMLPMYPVNHVFAWVAMAMLLTVGALNLDFFGWLYQKKGLRFVCLATLFHWLHYLTSGAGFVAGTAVAVKIWVASARLETRSANEDLSE